jgi:PAS domain-containing protein
MAGPAAQRPLELILARNLLSSLSTPALLVNRPGDVVFYNEAAGAMLGRRFEDTGSLSAGEWTAIFGPLDASGQPMPIERQPLTSALRANRAGHRPHVIRSATGVLHHIEVTGVPIMGSGGFQGAMLFFWPASAGVVEDEDGVA